MSIYQGFEPKLLSGCCEAPLKSEFPYQSTAAQQVCSKCGKRCLTYLYKCSTVVDTKWKGNFNLKE
jgi:hypothetical protein